MPHSQSPPSSPSANTAPAASPVAFISTKPSGSRRIIKWVLLTPLILIALAILWSLVSPYVQKLSWEAAGKPLPGCTSEFTVNELAQEYGFVYQWLAKLPMSSGFRIRRAKEMTQPEDTMVRYCIAEYASLVGTGELRYRLTWYDRENRDLNQLKVEIYEFEWPDAIKKLKFE